MNGSAPPGPIVVGYTPDSNGADAIALAKLLGAVTGARLLVVSVVSARSSEEVASDVVAEVQASVEELLASGDGGSDVHFDVSVETSRSPARHIYEAAESVGASMIVVGPTEVKARRWRPGTVLHSILQGAPCAVAVAPSGYGETVPAGLTSVAAAFNRSEEATVATEAALELAISGGADLTLVSVVEPVPPGYGAVVAALTASEWESHEEKDKRAALDEAVGDLRERLGDTSTAIDGLLLGGLPGDTLAEASADFDLMVVGSREYGPFRRTLVGSTSRTLVAKAACPVIVTPRP